MTQIKAKILVVDDAPDMVEGLKHILTKNSFSVFTASRAEKALPIIESTEIDMVISDVQMPGMSGIELMDKAHEIKPDLPFLMITGFASVQSAVQAMKKGAYHYVSKPFNNDEILLSVNRALEAKLMQKELEELRRKIRGDSQWLGIIGHSGKMRSIFELVQRIGTSSASVLIQGESGTGKELIARAIHRCGPRNDKRFVAINTTALPETLLESELFGYYKGAFTGAEADKKGLFVEASGGTLFSGRDRIDAAVVPGQTSARDPGERGRAAGRERTDKNRHAYHLRHQLRSCRGGQRQHFPQGPALPA